MAISLPPTELLRLFQLAGDGQQASPGKQRHVLAYVKDARDMARSKTITLYDVIVGFNEGFTSIQTTNAVCWTSVRFVIGIDQEDDKKKEEVLIETTSGEFEDGQNQCEVITIPWTDSSMCLPNPTSQSSR